MRYDENHYRVFDGVRRDARWEEFKNALLDIVGKLRVESDTISDEQEIRISQGRRRMLIELVNAVEESGKVLDKLRQGK